MIRIFLSVLLVSLTGCAYKVTVYGESGKSYIAPDLCGAVVACHQAKETKCLYNATTMITADGKSTETNACSIAK